MSRWTLAGCMALAAMGAAAALDVGATTAEAAPSASRFAGSYVGKDPRGWYSSWAVTVSDRGQIAGTDAGTGRAKGTISGEVGADGSYSMTVSQFYLVGGTDGPRDKGKDFATASYTSTGTMTLDTAGNIVGTTNTVSPFTWTRQ